jgi:hypothetical protein
MINARFREQMELDSMDFWTSWERKRHRIQIPEDDGINPQHELTVYLNR